MNDSKLENIKIYMNMWKVLPQHIAIPIKENYKDLDKINNRIPDMIKIGNYLYGNSNYNLKISIRLRDLQRCLYTIYGRRENYIKIYDKYLVLTYPQYLLLLKLYKMENIIEYDDNHPLLLFFNEMNQNTYLWDFNNKLKIKDKFYDLKTYMKKIEKNLLSNELEKLMNFDSEHFKTDNINSTLWGIFDLFVFKNIYVSFNIRREL